MQLRSLFLIAMLAAGASASASSGANQPFWKRNRAHDKVHRPHAALKQTRMPLAMTMPGHGVFETVRCATRGVGGRLRNTWRWLLTA